MVSLDCNMAGESSASSSHIAIRGTAAKNKTVASLPKVATECQLLHKRISKGIRYYNCRLFCMDYLNNGFFSLTLKTTHDHDLDCVKTATVTKRAFATTLPLTSPHTNFLSFLISLHTLHLDNSALPQIPALSVSFL